jgi:hypothetical protein
VSRKKNRTPRFVARVAAIAMASLTATVVGAGMASATTPPDPAGSSTPGLVAPHFYNGVVSAIRGSGSDTTFFMMQRLSDLFTSGGLYGCVLNSTSGQPLFDSTLTGSTSVLQQSYCADGGSVGSPTTLNGPTTDTSDNWDRTEVSEGVDDVGSGAGQGQLCGTTNTPLNVDFARSSKPTILPAASSPGPTCPTEVETGYAKDGVPVIEYPINPNVYGTSTSTAYGSVNGGIIGDVTSGWLPGDPAAGPYSGTPLTNISNADNGGGFGSTAYRLWCATGATRITDWGQLTNLGPNMVIPAVTISASSPNATVTTSFPAAVASGDAVSGANIQSGTTVVSVSGNTVVLSATPTGSGTEILTITTGLQPVGSGGAIGLPVRIMGVNPSSGTEATFASYADSGEGTSGNCSSNMNSNAALDPNSATATGTNATAHIALENNSDQLDQFAIGDFPGTDYVDQAIEVNTSLYIESNGVFNTNPYAAASTIDGTSYSGTKLTENGVNTQSSHLLANSYPTARTLFNIYRSDTVRASTAGFLNWICDSNTNYLKGIDNTTGLNFDTEVTTAISSVFGFPRLTDASKAVSPVTPLDAVPAPNDTCSASLPVTTTIGTNTITLTTGGPAFPASIVNAGGLNGSQVNGANNVVVNDTNFPAGTYVVSGAGTNTLTLSQNATASGTSVTTTFTGVPAVTSVGQATS